MMMSDYRPPYPMAKYSFSSSPLMPSQEPFGEATVRFASKTRRRPSGFFNGTSIRRIWTA